MFNDSRTKIFQCKVENFKNLIKFWLGHEPQRGERGSQIFSILLIFNFALKMKDFLAIVSDRNMRHMARKWRHERHMAPSGAEMAPYGAIYICHMVPLNGVDGDKN